MSNLITNTKFQFTNPETGVTVVSEVLGVWWKSGEKYEYDLCDFVKNKGMVNKDNFRTRKAEDVDKWVGTKYLKFL